MRRIAVLAAVSVIVASVAVALAASAAGVGSAGAERQGQVLSASLVPDLGPSLEPTIGGIAPGGKPWVLTSGHATLTHNGELTVSVVGLLFAPDAGGDLPGTTGPIAMVSASVVCAGGQVITTGTTPFSAGGDAHFAQRIALPAQCVGPIVLVRANGSGPWLAASGV